MSGLIQMSPDELRSKAVQYQNSGHEISSILTKLNNLQSELRSEWKGQAFTQFDNQFQDLSTKVENFSQLMHEIYDQLTKTANAVEDQDRQLSQNFGFR